MFVKCVLYDAIGIFCNLYKFLYIYKFYKPIFKHSSNNEDYFVLYLYTTKHYSKSLIYINIYISVYLIHTASHKLI